METLAGLIGGMFVIVMVGVLIAIVLGVFWLWMLIDCIRNNRIQGTEKAVWIIITLFGSWLGGIVYYFVIRKGESTGFLKFIGVTFTILITIFLVIGLIVSAKRMINEDQKVIANSNEQVLLKNPIKQ